MSDRKQNQKSRAYASDPRWKDLYRSILGTLASVIWFPMQAATFYRLGWNDKIIKQEA
jgi:hypothetical protein